MWPQAELSFLHPIFSSEAGEGGYLAYLFDGDVPFFRISTSPLFSSAGYQIRQVFKSWL